MLNVEMPALIKIKDKELRRTNNFTYLGSITPEGDTKEGGHLQQTWQGQESI